MGGNGVLVGVGVFVAEVGSGVLVGVGVFVAVVGSGVGLVSCTISKSAAAVGAETRVPETAATAIRTMIEANTLGCLVVLT